MPHPARSADHPITSNTEDLLGRAELAALMADEVRGLNVSHGAVVGVLGDWGSGKTSLLNKIVEQLEASTISVVEFNPWLFSGTEQLVTTFFEELAAQLRPKGDRLASIAGKLQSPLGAAGVGVRHLDTPKTPFRKWADRLGVVAP